jgi:glycine hydroxymethyltransferase
VLAGTTAAPGKKAGEKSKAKYEIDPAVKANALEQVGKLLARFPVYPELDLEFLKKHFGE